MGHEPAPAGFGPIHTWTTVGLIVEDVHALPGLRLRGHGHGQPHLCWVEAGAFEEREPYRTREAAAGTLRVSPAGDEHDITFGSRGGRCTIVLVRDELADATSPVPQQRRFLRDDGIVSIAAGLRREMARLRDGGSPLVAEMLVLELLATTTRSRPGVGRRRPGRPPAWLEQMRELLAEPSETSADIAAVARAAGYHPVYVARAFRRWFGMGPAQYARTIRLDRARRLVLHSAWPIARIAAETGFTDQSHLTRSFRRRLGVSPASLRRGRPDHEEVARVQDPRR